MAQTTLSCGNSSPPQAWTSVDSFLSSLSTLSSSDRPIRTSRAPDGVLDTRRLVGRLWLARRRCLVDMGARVSSTLSLTELASFVVAEGVRSAPRELVAPTSSGNSSSSPDDVAISMRWSPFCLVRVCVSSGLSLAEWTSFGVTGGARSVSCESLAPTSVTSSLNIRGHASLPSRTTSRAPDGVFLCTIISRQALARQTTCLVDTGGLHSVSCGPGCPAAFRSLSRPPLAPREVCVLFLAGYCLPAGVYVPPARCHGQPGSSLSTPSVR
ncbi:hypothetical protein B0H11DRAFT_2240384 [Mycena galericulata]|nr:hypothetical protein B0H11DRAFT_2240384 [Mycena galericulata]